MLHEDNDCCRRCLAGGVENVAVAMEVGGSHKSLNVESETMEGIRGVAVARGAATDIGDHGFGCGAS